MKDYRKLILELVSGYEKLGVNELDDGTKLIGKAPHIALKAWLHKIYSPLNNKEIRKLSEKLDAKIPKEFEIFLKQLNGVKFFNTTFTIDGYVKKKDRSVGNWQPFDLTLINIDERPLDAEDNVFFIGGYDWDNSLLYINMDNNKVFRCSYDSIEPLNEWESLEDLIISEFERLRMMFTDVGVEFDEEQDKTP